MPQSPYGLAYGIGAGLNVAQDQFQRRQSQAMQMGLQQLALQRAQEEEAQRQAMNEVMSARISPEMVAPTREQAMQSAVGMRPVMGGLPTEGTMGLPGIPQGGVPLGPGVVAGGPVPTLGEATAPRERKYHTPYEKLAYDLSKRAQMLADRGFGMSSMKLMEEASRVQQLHTETLGRDAASSIIRGGRDAAEKLEALGWPGVRNVGRKGDVFFIEDESGNMTTMDYNDLAALSAGSAKLPEILQRIGSSENRLRSQQFTQEEMTRRAQANAKAAIDRAEAAGQFRIEAERIKATRPFRGSASAKDNWIQRVEFRAKELSRAAAERGETLSPRAAMDQAFELIPPPGAGASPRGGLTPAQRLADIRKQLADMKTSDPRRQALEDEAEAIRKGGGTVPEPPKASNEIPTPASKAEYDKLPSGSKYIKGGKVYIKG